MALETEAVLDRRALRRKVGTWRAIALAALVIAGGAAAYSAGIGLNQPRHVARVAIEGLITDNRRQLEMLRRIANNKSTAGLLLSINSSGGTTTGGEALYEAIREVAAKKPVVAHFGTVAASAAYIAGLGADHIVSRGNSITGSVGVIFQYPDVSALMEKIGVKMNEIRSGPLKAVPSMFEATTPESRKVAETLVMDGQRWFLALVKSRRSIDTATVPGLEQGRVFSGREALQYKLVDEIGGEDTAIRWLETAHKLPVGTKVIEWKPRADAVPSLFRLFTRAAFEGLASDGVAVSSINTVENVSKRLLLDGLVSVWQPYEK